MPSKAARELAELSARKRRKLTPEQRADIRRRRKAGEPVAALAAEFGVSTTLIYMVAQGHR